MSFRALARAHFQLAGGWRQNLVILAAYFGLVALIATFLYRTSRPADHAAISAGWLSFLSVVQGILVLLAAPGGIRKAVRRDFQSGMMESHRLTPLTGLDLVLGYLTGPSAQALLLYGAGLLVGTYFAVDYGASLGFINVVMGGWYFAQLCLLPLAAMVASLVLLTALATRGKVDLTLVLAIVGLVGGWFFVALVPGLALLFDVLTAGWMIRLLARSGPPIASPSVMGWAMLLQATFALILLTAACRKVRAPERPVFDKYLGLLLLAVTGVTLAIGMALFPGFNWFYSMDDGPVWQWLASTVVFMLVALFPLIAAATERAPERRERPLGVSTRPGVDLMPLLLALMTVLVMYWMLPVEVEVRLSEAGLRAGVPVVLALALGFWTDYLVAWWARARGRNAFFAILVEWLVLKAAPLVAAAAVLSATEAAGQPEAPAWWLAGFSPIGTLVVLTRRQSPWAGLVFQVLVMAGVAAIVRRRAASAGRSR